MFILAFPSRFCQVYSKGKTVLNYLPISHSDCCFVAAVEVLFCSFYCLNISLKCHKYMHHKRWNVFSDILLLFIVNNFPIKKKG